MRTQLTNSPRKWIPTRIESWASSGFPDLFLCDDHGRFHTVELKHTFTNRVDLSPHQVSFHVAHKHASSWILIKREWAKKKGSIIYLYHASHSVDVKMEGLETKPARSWENLIDWTPLLNYISPPDGSKNAFLLGMDNEQIKPTD